MLGFGVWVLLEKMQAALLFPVFYRVSIYGLIATGSIIFLASIVGCYGTTHEHYCSLITVSTRVPIFVCKFMRVYWHCSAICSAQYMYKLVFSSISQLCFVAYFLSEKLCCCGELTLTLPHRLSEPQKIRQYSIFSLAYFWYWYSSLKLDWEWYPTFSTHKWQVCRLSIIYKASLSTSGAVILSLHKLLTMYRWR